MKEKTKGFKLLDIIIIVIITAVVSGLTCGVIVFNSYQEKSGFAYASLTKDDSLKEFLTVYASILDDYYEKIDNKEMLNKAIDAMLKYLGEDYSNYLTESETKELEEKLKGTYEGLGVSLNGENIILEVFENSPADKAGIKINDKVISVNGTDVTSESSSKTAKMIQDTKGDINLGILRDNEKISFVVEKSTLNVPAITYEVVESNNKKVGFMAITTFSQTLEEQVRLALNKMETENIEGVVIDVRGNTGGYLTAATGVANLFLEKGKLIYTLEGKDGDDVIKDETSDKKDYKVVILMDGGSASASEILAAALKDSYGAILVGEKSFGKGKVQQTMKLTNGSMVKYTSAKWLRPNGECIDGIGLIPDYEVELDIKYDEEGNIKEINDTQKTKAIELLVN